MSQQLFWDNLQVPTLKQAIPEDLHCELQTHTAGVCEELQSMQKIKVKKFQEKCLTLEKERAGEGRSGRENVLLTDSCIPHSCAMIG